MKIWYCKTITTGLSEPERGGFIYNKELDQYECQRGNKAILPLKSAMSKNGDHYVKRYSSSKKDCENCPLQEQCCGKKTEYKKLDDSIHKEYYDRMHKKLTDNKEYAKRIFRSRSSTVEPVFGTLINFFYFILKILELQKNCKKSKFFKIIFKKF